MATKRLLFSCVVLMALTGSGTSLWGQTAGFAYVVNGGSFNVSAYVIDGTTGALTEVAGSPFPAGVRPQSVTVDPTGQFAYVANGGSFFLPGNVSAYSINGSTGALTPVAGSPFPAGPSPRSVTVDPTGQFAYVANCGIPCASPFPGSVSAYTIDGTTGALTEVPGSPFLAGSGSFSVTVHPTGQFGYVANCASTCGGIGPGNVSAYSIDGTTGALTPVVGSPFPAGSGPRSVTVDPTGQFAYVANQGGNVSAYAIDGTTGALTPVVGSPFPAGTFSISVTVHPTGQFVYVANTRSANLSAYSIDGTTGALTPVAGSPFPAGAGPQSVTVDPTGQFAYVANFGSGNVSAYTIDGTTGALTPVAGSPFPAGANPQSVTTTAGPPPPVL
jgi:DNA-binding beta-propeller fold protein YncE